jgi:hypothetical protein
VRVPQDVPVLFAVATFGKVDIVESLHATHNGSSLREI